MRSEGEAGLQGQAWADEADEAENLGKPQNDVTIDAPLGRCIMDFIESFRQSKRTKLTVVSLVGVGFRIYQLVSEGQPVPAELILSAVAIVAAWIGGDSYRPTVKPEVAK